MLLSTDSINLINQPLQKSITRADAKAVHKELPPGGQWKTLNGHHIYIKDGKVLAGAVPGVGKAKKATKAQLQEHQNTLDQKGAKPNAKKNASKTGPSDQTAKPAAAKPGGKKTSPAAGKKGGKVDESKPVPKTKKQDGPDRTKAGDVGATKPKGGKSPVKRNAGSPALVVSKDKGKSKKPKETPVTKKKGAEVGVQSHSADGKDVRRRGGADSKPSDAKPKKAAKPAKGPEKPEVPVSSAEPKSRKPKSKRATDAHDQQPKPGATPGNAAPGGKMENGRTKPDAVGGKPRNSRAKKPAAEVADVRTEGQLNNELAYDVGAAVWGSRKDQAAAREALNDKVKRGVSVRGTLADLEKLDPGAARKYCTKDNILQKYDWEAQQRQGVDLPVAVMKKLILDRILPKPDKDDPEVRRQYASAIEELHRLLAPVKNMQELKDLRSSLRDRMMLELPGHLAQQERYLQYAQAKLDKDPTDADLTERRMVGYDPKKGGIYDETKLTKKQWKADKQKRVDEIKAKIAQYHENVKNPYHVLGEKLTNFFTDSDSANRTIDTVRKKDMKWEDYLDPQAKEVKPKRNRKAEWERKVDDPWFRSGGRASKVEKPEDVIKQFKLRGVQFGHWVDDASGKFHLLKASEALQDMADTLGMKDADVSLNGRLALAFGARGTGGKHAAVAHYEPDLRVINLTKEGGAGSLAHEWGHALDDILGDHSGIGLYASESPDQVKNPEVQKAYTELMDAIYKGDGSHKGSEKIPNQHKRFTSIYPRRREAVKQHGLSPEVVKQFTDELNTKFDREQRVIEGTIEKLKQMGYDTSKREKELKNHLSKKKRELNELHQELMYHHEKHTGESVEHLEIPTDHSEYYSRMREEDGERSKPYFSTGREMFARVFESWMEDTLAKNKTQNNYLVANTSEKHVKVFGAPFPQGSERKHMFEKMGNLMKAVVGTGEIKKALEMDLQKSMGDISLTEIENKKRTGRYDGILPNGRHWREEQHPRDDFGKFVQAVEEHNEKLKKLAQRFGSAEEFAAYVDRPGFGGKSIAEITEMIDNNSHNHLDVNAIKTTLAQGGQQYYLTHVDPKSLYVQDEGHLEGVRSEAFDQSKAKPIVVGDNKFIVDGRHRNVNAKKSGSGRILAYVPAKHFYNQHVLGELTKSIIEDPAGNSPYPEDGTLMFRGIGEKERRAIIESGVVQSKGKGNDDDKGCCTCFTNRYQQAEGYARSQYDLYGESAGYVVILPKPDWVMEDEHGELVADFPVPAQLATFVHVGPELQKSVAWDESKHPRQSNGEFGSGESVTLFHGTALVHAETILKKGFKAQRSGNGDMGKCAYFKSPEWDHKEADDWGHTERTVNHFAEESSEKKESAPRVIKALIPKEHLLDCSKGRPQELQDMIDATRYKGLKDGQPRWDKNHSPYEAYAKKHGIKAIIDKLDTVWEDEGWQIGVYDPKIIQIIDSGKAVEGAGEAAQLLKSLTSEAPYSLIHHEYTATGDLVLHIGAH